LGCGTPVVSTDCTAGPREILQNGRLGPLVPVGDPEALAEAILAGLDHPPDPEPLRARALDFPLDKALASYRAVLGLR
jgi:glycosyltransferase involved in cell wall biosynthesis